MILTALQILTLTLLPLGDCLPVPDMADIVLETVEYNGKISGRVDFIGMQIYSLLTLSQLPIKVEMQWPGNKIDKYRNALSLFIDKLDVQLGRKIRVTQSDNFDPSYYIYSDLFPWKIGKYFPFLLGYQIPVNDDLSLIEGCLGLSCCLYPKSYKNRNRRMTDIALSQIKKYSNADYFLLIAIKPFESHTYRYASEDYLRTITVALLTTIYNREGKKIYSKIYNETLDVSYKPSLFPSPDTFPVYDCTMKLLKNQGEQIGEDLSFLLTADDAPSPTLEDLHNRLQQPGTIDDDVEYLKGFQGK